MSKRQKEYYDALDDLLDRPIAFNPAFKKVTGRTSSAVWLSQVYYWSKRTGNPDGWFYKTAKECEEETGLTDNEQKTARGICVKLGVIEEKLKGVPATMYYRLIKSRMYELLGVQFPTQQETEIPTQQETRIPPDGKQDSNSVGNINRNAETTTETTTERGAGLSEKEIQQANKTVDFILESSKKTKYQNRDKLPEPYLMFADLYNDLTKQEPTKRVILDWMGTFEDWKSEGLQPEHIRAAWQYANRPEGGFPVGRPGALTNTAVAMKSKMLTKSALPAEVERDPFASLKEMLARQETPK